jgi:hypothetical protein
MLWRQVFQLAGFAIGKLENLPSRKGLLVRRLRLKKDRIMGGLRRSRPTATSGSGIDGRVKRSKWMFLAGAAGGAAVGAGMVWVAMEGWQVLLPAIGYGASVGAIAGCVAAPPEYTPAKITLFITLIAVTVAVASMVALFIINGFFTK